MRGATGLLGAVALGGLAGCREPGSLVTPGSESVAGAEAKRRAAGGTIVRARLTPQPVTADLGGLTVPTWAYGDALPGPLIRAAAGDLLQITVDNRLPTETSVHWHGLALRNDMDGVPGITQRPIGVGKEFTYEFTAPDPGTYFYHPHSGVQLDRGLYGVLVIDDRAEPGDYDAEWVIVLDDWIDGTGQTPDDVLAELMAGGGSPGAMGGMGGMGGGGMMGDSGDRDGAGQRSSLLGHGGDVVYPHYLLNGRTPDAPFNFSGNPGQRVRIRIVNAGSDTAFRVALSGHQLTVTHSDGFPVEPVTTDALLIGMGERYDVLITLRDGVFAFVASAEGKSGQATAVVRTGSGRAASPDVRPTELAGRVLLGTDLGGAQEVRLGGRDIDRQHDLTLRGSMASYKWTINGKAFPDHEPLSVAQGERVRLRFNNATMMFHPMHVHGHTFGLRRGGARKDTVIVRPMERIEVDLDADNPGQWATHCHNIYHAESGMMTTLSYRA